MKLLLLLLLTSCGPQFSAPTIGTEGAEEYFTDRNMTGEDFQNFQTDASGDVVKARGDSSKHLIDRKIGGSAFSKQSEDYQAKIQRKGEITKGYTTDRLNGVRDPNRKDRDDITALDTRLTVVEMRLAAEESKSILQSLLIERLQLDLGVSEDMANENLENAKNALQGQIGSATEDYKSLINDVLNHVDGSLATLEAYVDGSLATLEAYVDSENSQAAIVLLYYANQYADAQDAALSNDIADLEVDVDGMASDIADLETRISDAEGAIVALEDDSDLVCSFTTDSVEVISKIPHNNHYHTGWRTIVVPTVTCPSN